MIEDKRLLEMAAKAAGIPAYWSVDGTIQNRPILVVKAGGRMGTMPYEEEWNPLRDDATALRLAVALRISVMLAETDPCTPDCAYAEALPGGPVWRYVSAKDDDPGAATRRAIVEAAAAIGERMP
jgi:hypothetical protein